MGQGGEDLRQGGLKPLAHCVQHVARHARQVRDQAGYGGAEVGLGAVQRVRQRQVEGLAIADQLGVQRHRGPVQSGGDLGLGLGGLDPVAGGAPEAGGGAQPRLGFGVGQGRARRLLGGGRLNLRHDGRRAQGQGARSQGSTPSDPSPSHRFNPAISREQRS
ncbi:hypothetical protein D3C73_862390 [compost metagenome]